MQLIRNFFFKMKIDIFFTTIILFSIIVDVFTFRQQTAAVKGRLLCGDKPASGVRVKLWDKTKLGSDTQLDSKTTDGMGNFELTGGIGSLLPMNVILKIYHDCDDGKLPCQRKVKLGIPSEYVTRSSVVEKWFDIGTLNLQVIVPDEERSCIN
ncbi:Transthyretin-like family-containing protein [Strongyloides ratti]|uniref:Transthyretin-like family-containing protein n=1 Tax=Strongyloides ratti TaxID=34506 RepID=A0A090KYB2_STRRB|nr:Transthyretin-like family-containing protein [Strongyloides ratti]CEF62426.1 Transthyretin-like family-containing protein [Strongyloides ratti]